MAGKIRSFTDLDAWREGHKLVMAVYTVTKLYPKEEIFGLTNQSRRCVVSTTSNIAEGFGRFSKKEKVQFYFMAQGSLTELQNQILIAKDIGYLDSKKFNELAQLTVTVQKLINGLIRKIKSI